MSDRKVALYQLIANRRVLSALNSFKQNVLGCNFTITYGYTGSPVYVHEHGCGMHDPKISGVDLLELTRVDAQDTVTLSEDQYNDLRGVSHAARLDDTTRKVPVYMLIACAPILAVLNSFRQNILGCNFTITSHFLGGIEICEHLNGFQMQSGLRGRDLLCLQGITLGDTVVLTDDMYQDVKRTLIYGQGCFIVAAPAKSH